MTTTSLRVTREPAGSHWQLGALPPRVGRVTLLEWQQSPSNDGGVPDAIVEVLSRALAATMQATFLSSSSESHDRVPDEWTGRGSDLIRGRARGLVSQVKGMFGRRPEGVALVSTRRPETLKTAFTDAGCPWWLQGQVILLSDPDTGAPEVTVDEVLALLDDGWAEKVAAMSSLGMRGAVRPGVDGDVAGVLTINEQHAEALLGALAREARAAGIQLEGYAPSGG